MEVAENDRDPEIASATDGLSFRLYITLLIIVRDRSRDRRDRRREKDVDVKTDPGVKTDFDAGANGGAYVKAEKMDE